MRGLHCSANAYRVGPSGIVECRPSIPDRSDCCVHCDGHILYSCGHEIHEIGHECQYSVMKFGMLVMN